MAALGYIGTGLGQGALQQRQVNRDEAYRQQAMGLQERGQTLQENQFEDSKRREDREFSRREVDRLRNLTINPDWLKTATPAMKEKVQSQLNRLYSKFPEFDYGEPGTAPSPTTAPEAPAAPPAEPRQAPVNPALFGLNGVPQPAPTNEQQIAQDIPQAGPSQFEPMGMPGLPDRPIPNTGQGVTGSQNPPVAGSFPPNILPPKPQGPTQAQITPPPQGTQQGPPKPFSAREYWLRRATDPALSDADKEAAVKSLQDLDQQEAQLRATNAGASYQEALAKEVAPNAASQRAAQAEDIAMSVYKRTEYMPAELRAALAKAQKGQQLDPSDLIAIEQLKLAVLKFSKEQGDEAWRRGQQLEEFLQRERLAGQAQGAAAGNQIRNAEIKALTIANTVTDPISRAVKFKPGGEQRMREGLRRLAAQGQQITPEDTNPGFDPALWTAVQDPKFDLNAAMSRVQGDPERSRQLREAVAMARGMAGAAAPRSSAPAASAPAAPGRPVNKARISQIVGDSSLTNSEKIDQLEAEGLPIPPSLKGRTGGVPVRRGQQKTDKDWVAPKMGPIEARRAEARRISQRR